MQTKQCKPSYQEDPFNDPANLQVASGKSNLPYAVVAGRWWHSVERLTDGGGPLDGWPVDRPEVNGDLQFVAPC